MRLSSILTFTAVYLPGYKSGGPIQSVANMVAHLGDEFAFRIVTRDRDAGDVTPYPGIVPGRWQEVGQAQVHYLESSNQTLLRIAELMRKTAHDVVYLNSFFNWRSSVLPLLAHRLALAPRRPVVLAPRGEFSAGALGIKSKKKRAFLVVSKMLRLHHGVIWQASSEHEAADIRAVFGAGESIHIASDLARRAQRPLAHNPRLLNRPLRILFLSRVSPMKNLTYLLDVVRRVTVPVDLSIVGPISDPPYWAKCQRKIAELPSNVRVSYDGIVPAEQVPLVMSKSDLFFLPTLGENFGHVIIESLGAGTPALISDQTPWKDLGEMGCGWVLPLENASAFVDCITKIFHEPAEVSAERRVAAIAYARRFDSDQSLINDNRRLFACALKSDVSVEKARQ